MRATFIALALLLTACSSAGQSANHATASPTPSQRASSSPAASGASLPCRLPVVTWTQQPQGQVASAGFLTYPGGQISPDATGHGSGSYDWPLKRWVPVKPRSISPDGSRYAYQSEFGAIHVVDAATAVDHTFKGPSGPDTVLYYAKEGVYFNHAWEGPPGPGLWLLDPSSGSIQTIFSDKPVDTVGGFAAWLPDINPADPHPIYSQFSGTNMPDRILRRDLNGGTTSPWFYQPGKSLAVIGFDADRHPLIVSESLATPDSTQVWQVPAANEGHQIYAGTDVPQTVADEHGIWFSDKQGIYLYKAGSGLQKISTVTADLAGTCR